MKELKEILQSLKLKLENFSQSINYTKKLPYELMHQNEQTLILKSEAPELAKKKLILSEIVKLRINIFSLYSEQIQTYQKSNNTDKAVNLMNDYIETIAIPFMSPIKHPSSITNFKKWLSGDKTPTPFQLVEKWKTDYKHWFQSEKSGHPEFYERERMEELIHLQSTYELLYNYSFTRDSNPESQNFILIDPTKIKLQ